MIFYDFHDFCMMVNLDSLQLLETQVAFKYKHTFNIGRTSKMISMQQRVVISTVGNTNTHTHTHTHAHTHTHIKKKVSAAIELSFLMQVKNLSASVKLARKICMVH